MFGFIFLGPCHRTIMDDFPSLLTPGYPCVYGYTGDNRDRDPFGPEEIHNKSSSLIYVTDEAWCYDTGGDDASFSYSGEFWRYEGDGFGIKLVVNIDRARTSVTELKDLLWIDRQTRAIFLEFILFNANANLFSFVSMRLEFGLTGLVVPRTSTTLVRLYATGFTGIYQRVVEVAFVALLLANVVVFLYLSKTETFGSFWRQLRTYLDLVIFTNGAALIAIYLYRYFITKDLVTELKGGVIHFIPFERAVFYHNLFMYLLASITSLCVLKFVVLLRLNERIAKFAATLKHSAGDILSVGAIFFVIMTAYAVMCALTFRDHYVFSSFIRSVEMLFAFSLGEFTGLGELFSHPTFTVQLFVFTYAIFSNILMINILISVIVESHESFHFKSALQPKDHELVQEIFGQVQTGIKKTLNTYVREYA